MAQGNVHKHCAAAPKIEMQFTATCVHFHKPALYPFGRPAKLQSVYVSRTGTVSTRKSTEGKRCSTSSGHVTASPVELGTVLQTQDAGRYNAIGIYNFHSVPFGSKQYRGSSQLSPKSPTLMGRVALPVRYARKDADSSNCALSNLKNSRFLYPAVPCCARLTILRPDPLPTASSGPRVFGRDGSPCPGNAVMVLSLEMSVHFCA
ncbi:uncharacterized protein J3D65DRAFT_113568 [Phyllosticta citribraziliensis]|uniref:Uncharacterized protein n=1 Tax=Phyllosticta citribraziliensis TaxID=989973 RepID=A0ABR1L844_9PEZI